jgi:NADPH:quinone reductase-like Zn-dependent oxidoreductase
MCVFLARSNSQDLSFVRDLVASGKVTPLIDRRFALTAVPEAVSYLEQGHALGKVVIEVAGENAI